MGHTQSCTLGSSMAFGALTELVPLTTEKRDLRNLTDDELSSSLKILKDIVALEIDLNEKYLLWLDGQRRKAKQPVVFGSLNQRAFIDQLVNQANMTLTAYLPLMIQLVKIQKNDAEVKKLEDELNNSTSPVERPKQEDVKIDLTRVDFMRLKTVWTLELAYRVMTMLEDTKDLSGSEQCEEATKFLEPFLELKNLRPQLQDSALARLDPMPTVPAIAEWGIDMSD